MSSSSSSPIARFPAPVREAYERFVAHRQPADLHIVIDAALQDFRPKNRTAGTPAPLRAESRLIEDLGFDSLAVAETVFFFEDLFQITIQNQDILALQTVADLHAFVERKLTEQTS
jgi:acyl carrier protein